jgi:dipeptidyl-peptidase-4
MLAIPMAGAAEVLTIERIFDSPTLSGPGLRNLKVSPAGDRVTFLRGKDSDQEQLDLWEYHIADAALRPLVDSLKLLPEEGELSEEEKGRRERQRIAGLRGIVDYVWAANGQALLFPLGGDVYLYDLTRSPDQAVRRITETEAFETDPQLSPNGGLVGFVRDQNLFLLVLETGREIQLTSDGGGVIKNGMAEFVAQEEMDRDTGYWISPDDQRVAFLQVDQSPVSITRRYEIGADNVTVIEQRYPYAGTPNVNLKLGVASVAGGDTLWIDLGANNDQYIPRVQWLPDGKTLSYQRQSRNQQQLELYFVDVSTGKQRRILTETSRTWVSLHDDLHFLTDQPAFIWSSERSGFQHLYLFDLEGRLIRPLTAGQWQVDALKGVNETAGEIYFTATEASVLESQLYRQSLTAETPEKVTRVTRRAGMHGINMNPNGQVYLDRFSSPDQPPQVSLHGADGTRLTWLIENALDADHPYHPYLDAHRPTEFGTLEAEDGQLLHYRIIKPLGFQAGRQYPVFMYLYAGPTGQTVTRSWGRRLLIEQYMAQHGYVVFSIDNRGTPRRGVAFQEPAFKRLGQVELIDQVAGLNFIKSRDFVDPERVGLFGWSYGGYATLMGLMQFPDQWAMGVSVAPVTDWALYDTHYTERYMSTPQENPEGYQAGNVLTYAGRLQQPLMVIHGMADDNVLFSNSTKLFKKLQDENILFDVMTYPGGKHGISGQAAQTHVYRTITGYFDRHLKPE